LLPTYSNKLLLQWKGPFKVIERIRGNDCKIQLVAKTKKFHANMLKKYWNREQEEIGAMVIKTEILDENKINLFTSLQTETYKDVTSISANADGLHDAAPCEIDHIALLTKYNYQAMSIG